MFIHTTEPRHKHSSTDVYVCRRQNLLVGPGGHVVGFGNEDAGNFSCDGLTEFLSCSLTLLV